MAEFLPYFRTLSFFEGLDDGSILGLSQRLGRRRLIAGETLCRAGDPAGSAFVVIKGGLEVVSAGGRQVAIVRAGGGFGVSGLFTGHPHEVSAIAMGETWVFEIGQDAFEAASGGGDEFGHLLVDRVTRLLAGQLRLFDAALVRFETAARAKDRQVVAAKEVAPASVPGEIPADASDEQLLEWVGKVAQRSGIKDPDNMKIVQGAEIPIRRGPVT